MAGRSGFCPSFFIYFFDIIFPSIFVYLCFFFGLFLFFSFFGGCFIASLYLRCYYIREAGHTEILYFLVAIHDSNGRSGHMGLWEWGTGNGKLGKRGIWMGLYFKQ